MQQLEVNNKHLIVASCWFFSLHNSSNVHQLCQYKEMNNKRLPTRILLRTWLLEFNLQLSIEIGTNKQLKIIAFADDSIILTRGQSVAEAENYMNLERRKIPEWAQNNKLKFNENKSKVMLMSRRRRTERKETEIYVNNKSLELVNSTKY